MLRIRPIYSDPRLTLTILRIALLAGDDVLRCTCFRLLQLGRVGAVSGRIACVVADIHMFDNYN